MIWSSGINSERASPQRRTPIGILDASNDLAALLHDLLVGFVLLGICSHLLGGLAVVLLKQLGQEVVRAAGAEGGNLIDTVDAAGALGKIFLTVGETNGAVVAVHFHEAAQIHRLPHIVLGLTLDLDAETGVIAVLFLGGVEDHHDVLLQLVEAVVHQPDELAANKAIALEGQTAVPLTILGVLLDSPQAHQGDKLSGGIEHQRLEVLEVLRLQVIQNLVIAAGLDVRHTVARFDTVNAKVAVWSSLTGFMDVIFIRGGMRRQISCRILRDICWWWHLMRGLCLRSSG